VKTITVRTVELRKALHENREKHRAVFLDAVEGYRKLVVQHLERALEDAKRGRQIRTHVELAEPMDQTRDYDRVIRMLEMEVRSEVEVTEVEFAQYVMDDWSWKRQFLATNLGYTSHG
jgi:uncharacterized membrane protein